MCIIKQLSTEEIVVIDSDSSDEDEEELQYLHEDKCVPIFSSKTHFNYSEVVKILLSPCKDKLCVKQPILIEKDASFLIDLSKLDHVDDVKADDCGQWKHNGRKTTKVAVWTRKDKITKVVSIPKSVTTPPDENSRLYTLIRVYYSNDANDDFKRIYYYLYGEQLGLIFQVVILYFYRQ